MKNAFYILFIIILVSCSSENEKFSVEITTEKQYTVETFFTNEIGWGYIILLDNKAYIKQPHIPAVSGKLGFSSKQKAEKTAVFVIYKIKQGILPPSVNMQELDSLGVLM